MGFVVYRLDYRLIDKADGLEEAGHPVKLVYYCNSSHLIHAFPSLAPLAPETAAVMTLLKKWMNDVLKKEE